MHTPFLQIIPFTCSVAGDTSGGGTSLIPAEGIAVATTAPAGSSGPRKPARRCMPSTRKLGSEKAVVAHA